MLRIRTGARYGLRWGLCGFVAAVLTLSNDPTQAAPYADIVVDANSGAVLHATNPDARRHPASLTKIMTLYLLFEQLEAGKLKLDTPLKVSAEAAGQTPTMLGFKPGSTLAVEDAINGLPTRSVNAAAVGVAGAIAGSEDDYAKLMTNKAQALGMNNTVYKNASGLPDDNQVTTARDQSTLGRAIQERFPRYYKYFAIRSFTFRGEAISNHNHLLGKVEGVDGIKTGYINASGFNLVTSVHRGNRYLVAVVMGGSSGGSRDAKMRDLISEKIVQASTKRTAPMVAEANGTPDFKPEPMVVTKAEAKPEPKAVAKAEPKPDANSKPEPKPEPMVVTKPEPKVAAAKVEPKEEPKAEAKAESRFAVASATSLPVRFNLSAAPAEPAAMRSEPAAAAIPTQARVVAGSTEPIRPVLVKTLTVKAGVRTASLAPLHVASPAAEPQPAAAAPAATPVAAAKPEPAAPPPAPVAAAKPEPSAPPPAPVAVAKPEPSAPPAPVAAAKSESAAAAPAVATKPEPATAPSTPAITAKAEPAAPPAVAVAAAKPEPAAEPPAPAVPSASPAPVAAAAAPAPAAPAAKAAPTKPTAKPAAAAAPAAKPQHKPGWMIQVGAYPAEQAAKQRLSTVQTKASKILTGAEAFTETIDKGGTTYYRAR